MIELPQAEYDVLTAKYGTEFAEHVRTVLADVDGEIDWNICDECGHFWPKPESQPFGASELCESCRSIDAPELPS